MNKVICDVCGTKYPENAEQCPICGCAKPDNARIAADDVIINENKTVNNYTHVKGGRFSKSNVRKRNKAAERNNENTDNFDADTNASKKENNTGLVIAVVALLIAVIAAMLFVFFRYFAPFGNNKENNTNDTNSVVQSTVETSTETTPTTEQLEQVCTCIVISTDTIHFDELGDTFSLNVELTPADTTDVVIYESSNPEVASVSADGNVTSVSAGEAVITVTCGAMKETCNVVVADTNATTEDTTAETTAATTASDLKWKLNREDISFNKKDDAWKLYKGDIDVEEITWTSDDPAIATFEKGVVTAIAPGVTKVHAEYNGEKYSCIIRCVFTEANDDETNSSTNTEATTPSTQTTYELRINGTSVDKLPWKTADVTISVKESFQLTLCTENGDIIAVSWSASKDNICTINGNTVTGKTKGTTEIFVNYSGKTYSCKVTVR